MDALEKRNTSASARNEILIPQSSNLQLSHFIELSQLILSDYWKQMSNENSILYLNIKYCKCIWDITMTFQSRRFQTKLDKCLKYKTSLRPVCSL